MLVLWAITRWIIDFICILQPAFYEAFGLTVVEAMTCALPTFATAYGGPAEIIVHGVSGFHIDPYQGDKAAETLVDFFEKSKQDPSHWDKISQGGLQRIYEKSGFLFIPNFSLGTWVPNLTTPMSALIGTLGSSTPRGWWHWLVFMDSGSMFRTSRGAKRVDILKCFTPSSIELW